LASNVDGSVVIDVDFNINDAEKELARLKTKVFKLEDEVSEKTAKSDVLKERFRAAEKEFDALSKKKNSFDTTIFSAQDEARIAELGKTMQNLDKEIKAIDEDIDQGNVSLEWTKQRYGEIVKIAERLQTVQKSAGGRESAEISDQHIADLSQELAQLKQRLAELKKSGIGLGHREFDEITSKIAAINREIKEYEKNLTSVSDVDLSGSAATKVADEMFQDMADHAQETMKWVERLRDDLADLEDRKSSLGLAFGARDEYREIQSEIDSVTAHLNTMLEDLDSLARSGALGRLAGGSEIAEQRIRELENELDNLNRKQANLGMAFGAKKEYESLSVEIERVSGLIDSYEKSLSDDAVFRRMAEDAEVANQHIVDLCQELEELKETQKELEQAGIGLGFQEYDENVSRISEINKELKKYKSGLSDSGTGDDGLSGKFEAAQKMTSILGKLSKTLGGSGSIATEGAAAAEGLAGAAAGMEGLSASAAAAGPAVIAVVAAIALLKAAADKIAEEAKKLTTSFAEFLKNGVNVLKKFGKYAVKAFQIAASGALVAIERMNVFPKMFSSIGKSLKQLGRTVKSALVFSVIYKGLSMLRQQMSAYLMVNAQFATSLRRLQGVLLTAFQPIYEVVVPALTTLINVLSRAIAVVAQFIAALFGKTAKQAQQNASALNKQAGATTAAGNAAEEAALQLAEFDEINKLEGNKSAGGGGGGGVDVDTGPLFDWEYEDMPFDSWGEAFSAFLDKLLAGIPKLKEAFKNFADWLNDFTKKLYDMFTFPGILDKVKQLGHDLADALNYLVNQINWYQLGQALGAGLNLALNFLTSFLYTFDWINLGESLAGLVNGLASEVDWYEFGRLLWSGFKIGLETLAGFLMGLNMPLLAQSASNIVIGFFTEMKNTIERVPWRDIGWQIATFLVNLDWYGMLSSVTSAIAAGLMAAVAGISGFLDRIVPELDRIAGEIVQALIEFFRDKVEWDKLAQSIGDGIAAAFQFVAGLLNPELFYEIGSAIGNFLINLQWGEIFGGLAQALANGINSAIAFLRGILDEMTPEKLRAIADDIADKINKFVEDVNWEELGQTISDGIEAALDFLIELMDQIDWDAVGEAVANCLQKIDWDTLLTKWGTLLGEIMNAKMKVIDLSGALDIGLNIVKGIAKGMLNEFLAGGGIIGWLKRTFVDKLLGGVMSLFGIHSPSTVFEGYGKNLIEGLGLGISGIWHTITDFFGEKLGALKKQLTDKWDEMKQNASEKWSEIKDALGQKWSEIKEKAGAKFDEVKSKISEIWENTKTETSSKWDAIKSSLSDTWEKVKTTAQEKFTNIKESIIEKMGGLKNHDWKSIGSNVMDGIWSGLKSVWNSVTSWASNAAKWLGDAFNGAKRSVQGAATGAMAGTGGRSVSAASMPDISGYRIPALAQGAVIPPNREFLAVLGDQRSGNNLEGPEGLFRQIVRDENAAMIGVLQAILSAIREGKELSVDKTIFAKLVYGTYSAEAGRVGVRLTEVRG